MPRVTARRSMSSRGGPSDSGSGAGSSPAKPLANSSQFSEPSARKATRVEGASSTTSRKLQAPRTMLAISKSARKRSKASSGAPSGSVRRAPSTSSESRNGLKWARSIVNTRSPLAAMNFGAAHLRIGPTANQANSSQSTATAATIRTGGLRTNLRSASSIGRLLADSRIMRAGRTCEPGPRARSMPARQQTVAIRDERLHDVAGRRNAAHQVGCPAGDHRRRIEVARVLGTGIVALLVGQRRSQALDIAAPTLAEAVRESAQLPRSRRPVAPANQVEHLALGGFVAARFDEALLGAHGCE